MGGRIREGLKPVFGAPGGFRTQRPSVRQTDALPLSYRCKTMARLTGLEPATFGVTGRRSNQLSYNRIGAVCALRFPRCQVLSRPTRAPRSSALRALSGVGMGLGFWCARTNPAHLSARNPYPPPSGSPAKVPLSYRNGGAACAALWWWTLSGSNRRPPECKSGALPAELRAHGQRRVWRGGVPSDPGSRPGPLGDRVWQPSFLGTRVVLGATPTCLVPSTWVRPAKRSQTCVVDPIGIEPTTSDLRSRRSPI